MSPMDGGDYAIVVGGTTRETLLSRGTIACCNVNRRYRPWLTVVSEHAGVKSAPAELGATG
jgi:hypothetical protein